MKKSNALMLSYIIFLGIVLLANAFFKWDGIDRIAIAATIAGCFFAFADFCNWMLTLNNYYCDKLTVAHKYIADVNDAEMAFIEEREKEMAYILREASPYQNKDSNLDELIKYATDTLVNDNEQKENYLQWASETEVMRNSIEKKRKKSEKYEIVELLLMILGFVSFFAIIVFDYAVCFLTNYLSFATIIAFAVIMFNYYAKDVIEEKFKGLLEEMTETAAQNKSAIDKLNQEFKQINLLDKVNALIKLIKEQERATSIFKEDENNG